MGSLGLKDKIFGHPGYSADLKMTADELARFRSAIRDQWLATIRSEAPERAAPFETIDIGSYHKLAGSLNHEKLWPKRNRVLPKSRALDILGFDFVQRLRDELGPFSVSDVVYDNHVETGRPEVYWRLVRPGQPTDVGPMHADKWFHDIIGSDYGMPPGAVTIKLWIAVYCEAGRNGLLVVPDSHTRDWRYERVMANGTEKPQIRENVDELGAILVPTEAGTVLAFNERLLHGGAVNGGNSTRVSAEITLVFH